MHAIEYEKGGGYIIKKFIQRLLRLKADLLIGLGIGILIASIVMNLSYAAKVNFNVEREARKLGMVYPDEVKVIEMEKE